MSAAIQFVAAIQAVSSADAFNPYSDHCTIHDQPGAAAKRSKSLCNILDVAVTSGVHSLWVGRDLGHRGGRRTGLALTDDTHVPVHGERWGVSTERSTKGEPVKERTATLAWHILARIKLPIFLWNVFPLHPHEPDQPFTNRPHRASERAIGEVILSELISLLKPKFVIAIGGDAARSSERIASGLTIRVRHPSYGGDSEFRSQISEFYDECPRAGQ